MGRSERDSNPRSPFGPVRLATGCNRPALPPLHSARGGIRTRKRFLARLILSGLCIPVPPLGQRDCVTARPAKSLFAAGFLVARQLLAEGGRVELPEPVSQPTRFRGELTCQCANPPRTTSSGASWLRRPEAPADQRVERGFCPRSSPCRALSRLERSAARPRPCDHRRTFSPSWSCSGGERRIRTSDSLRRPHCFPSRPAPCAVHSPRCRGDRRGAE